jgi:hypothetical protein
MASADEAAREAPYAMDDEMKKWAAALGNVNSTGRHARATELGRRLLGRAEEARWSPQSLALAQVRVLLLTALDVARRAQGFPCPPASAEERALLRAIDDAVAARLEAGTLMRATPSEDRFLADLEAAQVPLLGRSDAAPRGSELGYVVAALSGSIHLVGLIEATLTGDSAPDAAAALAAHAAAVLRVLAFIAAERTAAASPMRGLGVMDQEADISAKMDMFFQVAAANDKAGKPLARHLPAGLLAQLQAVWQRVQAALGGEHARVAGELGRAGVAAMAARREATHAGWQPRPCAACGAPEAEPRQWKVCSRCSVAAYCCKEHQAAHWKAGHRKACREGSAAQSA